MTVSLPYLYSFRRCPYAMRARLGLLFAGLPVALREVVLKNKPPQLLALSPKGTVPVLRTVEGAVIDESCEIILWALEQQDTHKLLNSSILSQAHLLIAQNDNAFKYWLDRYKYADRYPQMTQTKYRQQGEVFLQTLEACLTKNPFLLGKTASLADIAIMPFIRQFAHVNRAVFDALPYPKLQQWLRYWLAHPFFMQAMTKFPPWQQGDAVVIFPAESFKPLSF